MLRGGYNKVLIKGGYYVEVSGSDGNKFLWEVVDNHVFNIGIRGFGFFPFMNMRRGWLDNY